MHSDRAILDLVGGLIYDAAGDAARWPAFLQTLGSTLRTTTNNIFLQNLTGPERGTVTLGTVGMDPAYLRSYDAYYGAINIYLICGARLFRQGQVYRNQELCPDEDACGTEFWNEWIAPQKMRNALFGVVLQEQRCAGMVNVVRHEGAGPFEESDLDLLRLLIPHLQRALQLHERITNLEIEKQAAEDALDRWPLGVILLDRDGCILLMNRSAERIIKLHDGLTLEHGILITAQPNKTTVLRNMIHCAIKTSLGQLGNPGGTLTLPRPSGKRALQVLVTPASPNSRLFPERSAAALFLSDPEASDQSSEDVLRQLYGLSRAESAVAALLMQGKDLRELSEELQMSWETGRTHVKRTFEKTGARRQTELTRLLLRGPAAIFNEKSPVWVRTGSWKGCTIGQTQKEVE